jgi:outer membrane biogenesis lipoprotein LolB
MRRHHLVTVSLMALLAGCTSPDTQANRRDTMTQRQRDSVLAQSGLPGAQGVAKALRASDSAKARNAQLDSASRP